MKVYKSNSNWFEIHYPEEKEVIIVSKSLLKFSDLQKLGNQSHNVKQFLREMGKPV